MLGKGTERIGAFISRLLGDRQRTDQPGQPSLTITNVPVKQGTIYQQVAANAGRVLVPRTVFMHEYLPEGVQGPQTDVGRTILEQKQEELKLKLADIVISRLAAKMTLGRLNPPLRLLLLCADLKDISPNLLIGREDLRTAEELEEASKVFLVEAVIATTGRLWEKSILEVSASERNTLRHLQVLRARRWSPRTIATKVCRNYGLQVDGFYKKPPRDPRPPQNPEPKFIRI